MCNLSLKDKMTFLSVMRATFLAFIPEEMGVERTKDPRRRRKKGRLCSIEFYKSNYATVNTRGVLFISIGGPFSFSSSISVLLQANYGSR